MVRNPRNAKKVKESKRTDVYRLKSDQRFQWRANIEIISRVDGAILISGHVRRWSSSLMFAANNSISGPEQHFPSLHFPFLFCLCCAIYFLSVSLFLSLSPSLFLSRFFFLILSLSLLSATLTEKFHSLWRLLKPLFTPLFLPLNFL